MMTPFVFAVLAAACYGVSYILAYKGGPWGVLKVFRDAIGAPECAVCWGAWVAAAAVALRYVVPPDVYDAVMAAAALSGVVTWLETKPFASAVTTTLGSPTFAMPGAATSAATKKAAAPPDDCPGCEKAKRAREAAEAARRAQPQPEPLPPVTTRGHGFEAG